MGPIETTLCAAHVLLEKGWTQGSFARDKDGSSLDIWDEGATCLCYSGAIFRVGGSVAGVEACCFVESQSGRCGLGISLWNDAEGRTQAEVLAENQRMIGRAAEMGV